MAKVETSFIILITQNYKIPHNFMKNWGSTLIFTNLVGAHPKNISTNFEANLCSGSGEEVKNGYHEQCTIKSQNYVKATRFEQISN